MACTFNGLDLEEMGIVGNPDVQYANFVAELISPKGYDGAVLSNFKRDYTTIKFDLALTGTDSERIHKMNLIASALQDGEQELIMPGMTDGYHFSAVPNMAIAPSRYVDGFVIPMTFVVPYGCAVKDVAVDGFEVVPDAPYYHLEKEFYMEGFMPSDWTIEAVYIGDPEGSTPWNYSVDCIISDESGDYVNLHHFLRPFPMWRASGRSVIESDTASVTFYDEMVTPNQVYGIPPTGTDTWGMLRPGRNKVVIKDTYLDTIPSGERYTGHTSATITFKERSIW